MTAHEVAHQWWAHQVIGADVQGATVLSETLSQYSALMVMKKKYGWVAMKKFLRYELDHYLRGRGLAKKRERPLARVEDDPYVHYHKGSLVMYALQDHLGEDTLNAAIRRFREETAYRGPPYPTSVDLVRAIRASVSADHAYLIEDLFETITLYDNHATKATMRDLGHGEFELDVEARAKKLRADDLGKENEVPLHDFVDIGALDDAGNVLHIEKVLVTSETVHVTMKVRGRVAVAGIDPRNMLIDRKPEDNVVPVVRE